MGIVTQSDKVADCESENKGMVFYPPICVTDAHYMVRFLLGIVNAILLTRLNFIGFNGSRSMRAFYSASLRRHYSFSYSIQKSWEIQMKPLTFALCGILVVALGGLSACSEEHPADTEKASHAQDLQKATWQPSPGHTQVPIWPGAAPDPQPPAGPEYMIAKDDHVIAGKPWLEVDNVSQPTMTVYAPKGKNTGVAVVVFPGGGYQVLAIDLEGTEVCDWLTSRGITAVLLKYRVPIKRVGPYWESPQALEDMRRGRWDWCVFMPRNGILIRTKSG